MMHKDMWMAVVYAIRDSTPGTFNVRSIERTRDEAEAVLRQGKPDLRFEQVVADFSYEATDGGLRYEVLRVKVAI